MLVKECLGCRCLISSEDDYCIDCEDFATNYLNNHYDNAIEQIRNALSDKNRVKFDAFSRSKQENLVDKYLEKGILKWSIQGGR
jgi:hypothetical protein